MAQHRMLAFALAMAATLAHAHGEEPAHSGHGGHAPASAPAQQTAFGIAGDPAKATRTVAIDMSDAMRFTPATLSVRRDETVRFVLANKGVQMHEMVIGAPEDLARHAQAMREHPGMQHDAPYMAHVKPGTTGEVVWRFNRAGTFQYACLVAGHFEAGMVGTITVK